jgi:hypothetical protein
MKYLRQTRTDIGMGALLNVVDDGTAEGGLVWVGFEHHTGAGQHGETLGQQARSGFAVLRLMAAAALRAHAGAQPGGHLSHRALKCLQNINGI